MKKFLIYIAVALMSLALYFSACNVSIPNNKLGVEDTIKGSFSESLKLNPQQSETPPVVAKKAPSFKVSIMGLGFLDGKAADTAYQRVCNLYVSEGMAYTYPRTYSLVGNIGAIVLSESFKFFPGGANLGQFHINCLASERLLVCEGKTHPKQQFLAYAEMRKRAFAILTPMFLNKLYLDNKAELVKGLKRDLKPEMVTMLKEDLVETNLVFKHKLGAEKEKALAKYLRTDKGEDLKVLIKDRSDRGNTGDYAYFLYMTRKWELRRTHEDMQVIIKIIDDLVKSL